MIGIRGFTPTLRPEGQWLLDFRPHVTHESRGRLTLSIVRAFGRSFPVVRALAISPLSGNGRPIPSRRAISESLTRSALSRRTSAAYSQAVRGRPWGRPCPGLERSRRGPARGAPPVRTPRRPPPSRRSHGPSGWSGPAPRSATRSLRPKRSARAASPPGRAATGPGGPGAGPPRRPPPDGARPQQRVADAPQPDTRAAEFTRPGDGFPSQDRQENPRRARARDRSHRPGLAVMS
jgi:hypothetical protein